MSRLPFRQVDVFGRTSGRGNPVAVVHDADDLSPARMQAFARWTNLSETTFLLQPDDPAADYRVRIFTPAAELPFAGHPTLGTAHAWLEAGGRAAGTETVVQECGVGLVEVRRGERLAFAAPELLRSGAPDAATLDRAVRSLHLDPGAVLRAAWIDNGPGWLGLQLHDAATVLGLEPDLAAMRGLKLGVLGSHEDPAGTGAEVEVRAFCPDFAVPEDPVTGSLNAGFAVWLVAEGVLPASYVARQGTAIGRDGRVHVDRDAAGTTWVGGATESVVVGTVAVGDA